MIPAQARDIIYVVAAVLFILDLKWMAHPRTAVRGNAVGALAMGLAILASDRFGGSMGTAIITIVTATTFFVQVIGPPCVKLAVQRAGEVGLNVTEEDLLAAHTAADMADRFRTEWGLTLSPEAAYAFAGVKKEWLDSLIAGIEENHGSVERYLSDAVGLGQEGLARLRTAYLEPAEFVPE